MSAGAKAATMVTVKGNLEAVELNPLGTEFSWVIPYNAVVWRFYLETGEVAKMSHRKFTGKPLFS